MLQCGIWISAMRLSTLPSAVTIKARVSSRPWNRLWLRYVSMCVRRIEKLWNCVWLMDYTSWLHSCVVLSTAWLASAIQVFWQLSVLPTVKGCLSIGRVVFVCFWYWSQLWKLPSDPTKLNNGVKLIWTMQVWKPTHLKALVVLCVHLWMLQVVRSLQLSLVVWI